MERFKFFKEQVTQSLREKLQPKAALPADTVEAEDAEAEQCLEEVYSTLKDHPGQVPNLKPFTLRNISAQIRDFRRKASAETSLPEDNDYNAKMRFVSDTFANLETVVIAGTTQQTELNLQLFTNLTSIILRNMKILFVKGDNTVKKLACSNGTAFPDTPCFPAVTELSIRDCDFNRVLWWVLGTVESLTVAQCNVKRLQEILVNDLSAIHNDTLRQRVEHMQNILRSFTKSLDVSDNQIQYLTPDIATLTLTKLNISGNPIKDLEVLKGISTLEELHISNIELSAIPNFHESLPCKRLKYLNVSNNGLTKTESLINFIRLHTLDLSSNSIGHWKEIGVLLQLKELKHISLVGNPLHNQNALTYRTMFFGTFRHKFESALAGASVGALDFTLDGGEATGAEVRECIKSFLKDHYTPDAVEEDSRISESPRRKRVGKKKTPTEGDGEEKEKKKATRVKKKAREMVIAEDPALSEESGDEPPTSPQTLNVPTTKPRGSSMIDPSATSQLVLKSLGEEKVANRGAQCSLIHYLGSGTKRGELKTITIDYLRESMHFYLDYFAVHVHSSLDVFFDSTTEKEGYVDFNEVVENGIPAMCLMHTVNVNTFDAQFLDPSDHSNVSKSIELCQSLLGIPGPEEVDDGDTNTLFYYATMCMAALAQIDQIESRIARRQEKVIREINKYRKQRKLDKEKLKPQEHILVDDNVYNQATENDEVISIDEEIGLDALRNIAEMLNDEECGVKHELHDGVQCFTGSECAEWIERTNICSNLRRGADPFEFAVTICRCLLDYGLVAGLDGDDDFDVHALYFIP